MNFTRQSSLNETQMRAPLLDPDLQAGPPLARQVLLVNPFYSKSLRAGLGRHVLAPSLALTSIAATTPTNWGLRYWDENLLQGPPPTDPMPEVVGITVNLTTAGRAYDLARWYKQRGARVILGGLHVHSCPDEAAEHCDAIVVGEGVEVWPQVLRDIEEDTLAPLYRGDYARPYRNDPAPRRDLLDQRAYLTTTSLLATRGGRTGALATPFRVRAPEQIATEIRSGGQAYVHFLDEDLGASTEYLRHLCEALRPLGIIWSAAVRPGITEDPSLVRLMSLSGCIGVLVNFRSLNDANVTTAKGRPRRVRDHIRSVAVFHDNGIWVNGRLALGFDNDTGDTFAETAARIEEMRLERATIEILTPYPGTPLFEQLDSEDRLLHRDWKRYDTAHAVFRPRHLAPDELEEGYAWCRRQVSSHSSIWNRRPEDWRRVLPHLATSYLYEGSGALWRQLIRHDLTALACQPVLRATCRWQLRSRLRLARRPLPAWGLATQVHPAG